MKVILDMDTPIVYKEKSSKFRRNFVCRILLN